MVDCGDNSQQQSSDAFWFSKNGWLGLSASVWRTFPQTHYTTTSTCPGCWHKAGRSMDSCCWWYILTTTCSFSRNADSSDPTTRFSLQLLLACVYCSLGFVWLAERTGNWCGLLPRGSVCGAFWCFSHHTSEEWSSESPFCPQICCTLDVFQVFCSVLKSRVCCVWKSQEMTTFRNIQNPFKPSPIWTQLSGHGQIHWDYFFALFLCLM